MKNKYLQTSLLAIGILTTSLSLEKTAQATTGKDITILGACYYGKENFCSCTNITSREATDSTALNYCKQLTSTYLVWSYDASELCVLPCGSDRFKA